MRRHSAQKKKKYIGYQVYGYQVYEIILSFPSNQMHENQNKTWSDSQLANMNEWMNE